MYTTKQNIQHIKLIKSHKYCICTSIKGYSNVQKLHNNKKTLVHGLCTSIKWTSIA